MDDLFLAGVIDDSFRELEVCEWHCDSPIRVNPMNNERTAPADSRPVPFEPGPFSSFSLSE
jgi:hypothetical protein